MFMETESGRIPCPKHAFNYLSYLGKPAKILKVPVHPQAFCHLVRIHELFNRSMHPQQSSVEFRFRARRRHQTLAVKTRFQQLTRQPSEKLVLIVDTLSLYKATVTSSKMTRCPKSLAVTVTMTASPGGLPRLPALHDGGRFKQ